MQWTTTPSLRVGRTAFVTGLLCLGIFTAKALGQGACCLIDDCVTTANEPECAGLGGVFLPGESCVAGACGEGACCFEDNCVTSDAYPCISSGRTFAGAGSSCLDDPCDSNIGACCLGGECMDLSPKVCGVMGGTWLGAGTNCGTGPCVVGACCLNVDCLQLAQHECDALNGTFVPGAACATDPCSKPLPECPTNTLFGQQRDGPNDFIAGTSEQSAGFMRFENFSSVPGSIETVRWWGLDLELIGNNKFIECAEIDPTFIISFHEDAGGVPGPAVCSYVLLATREPLGILYLGAELNRYEVQLPAPCVLVNGWISIVGMGDPSCWFLWMSAGLGQSYCQNCAAPQENFDLSVCLAGTEGGVFGACCVDATGVCVDNVEITNCVAGGTRFEPGLLCNELNPRCGVILGACCMNDATCSVLTDDDCTTAQGSWLGANTLCDQCPCITPCPEGAIPEGEPICGDNYVDTFNGGCTAGQPQFSSLALGETVCGESGIFFNGADNVPEYDWYTVQVARPMELTWTVTAEFRPAIWIVDANAGCPGNVLAQDLAFECDDLEISASVGPGTYWLVIAPSAFTDTSVCGARYTGTAGPVLSPADITGPLGVPDGCVDAFDLGAMLGAWCSAVNDPNPPSPPCENCTPANLAVADISGAANVPDGCVDAFDLAKLLAEWCSVAGGNPCGTCFP